MKIPINPLRVKLKKLTRAKPSVKDLKSPGGFDWYSIVLVLSYLIFIDPINCTRFSSIGDHHKIFTRNINRSGSPDKN